MSLTTGTIPDASSTTLYFGPWYRKSPFFEATLRWGCQAYDIYNHMYLPAYYDDLAAEYWALVNDVTLWDVGVERVVEISGPDGFELANAMTCRDLTRCAVGPPTATPTCTRWAWPRAWASTRRSHSLRPIPCRCRDRRPRTSCATSPATRYSA